MTRSDKSLAALARWLAPHLGTAVTNFDPRTDSDERAAEVGTYIAETSYFNLAEADIIAAAKATERRDVLAFLRDESEAHDKGAADGSLSSSTRDRLTAKALILQKMIAAIGAGEHVGAGER